MARALLLCVAALAVAACGPRERTLGQERGPEPASCVEALRVREEVLAGATTEAARAATLAAADLSPCEDGDPATGVTADLADLRQRLVLARDRAQQQPQSAPAKKDKGSRSKGN